MFGFGRKRKRNSVKEINNLLDSTIGRVIDLCDKTKCIFYVTVNIEYNPNDILLMNYKSFICLTCKHFKRDLDHFVSEKGAKDAKSQEV